MRKSMIVAMDLNNGIGYQNRLPWRLPADMRMLKQTTMGHHLIMGRKTYESIGKPLPGRISIVVTRNPSYVAEGCLVTNSVSAALALAESRGEDEAFIFGGNQIFKEGFPYTDRIYLTQIQVKFEVDTYFPHFDLSLWKETHAEIHPANEENQYPFHHMIYDRRNQDD
jgi:dihydrofolate reductase